MPLKVGIVGLPNVGKSTLFKALTKKQIDIANYPFCTIEPNVGIVEVPDDRLKKLAETSQSARIVPTIIEFVDIAGLVKGAYKGEGLGNKFLANIREVDAIVHVVRDFQDDNIIHVNGEVNPLSDIETINLELIFADQSIIDNRINKLEKQQKTGLSPHDQTTYNLLLKIKPALESGQMVINLNLEREELLLLNDLNLLTAKPMIYVFNRAENEINTKPDEDNKIYLGAKIEAELSELPDSDKGEYLKELGIKISGLEKLITVSYKLLNLITFFTSGEPETRAWTVRRGAMAPEAAGKIHTDFEKGFIVAETISYDDFVRYNGWFGAKENGAFRQEGKSYIVKDGDVMLFRFNK